MIKNCYISVGDDGIAIKSGWDQYGIAYGRPSTNIIIHNVTIRSMVRWVISSCFIMFSVWFGSLLEVLDVQNMNWYKLSGR